VGSAIGSLTHAHHLAAWSGSDRIFFAASQCYPSKSFIFEKIWQGNVGQRNNSKKAIFMLWTQRLSTVFLFHIPLPNIPLPFQSFPSTIVALVAACRAAPLR
jgi:hypothetical protein